MSSISGFVAVIVDLISYPWLIFLSLNKLKSSDSSLKKFKQNRFK